jgi:hypothetical protein
LKIRVLTMSLLIVMPSFLHAEDRWRENGYELIFDMDIPYADDPSSNALIRRDVAEFQLYVMENPELKLISVSGDGGLGPPSFDIADTIMHFGFDTRAFGECLSACTTIFLAGRERTLADGAALGFHRPYITGEDERRYYLAHREKRGWDDEFDYVEFIYDVAYTEAQKDIQFMMSRGVSVEFIFEALSYDSYEMWTPDRDILLKNGILTKIFE